jgi:hypothetical protein
MNTYSQCQENKCNLCEYNTSTGGGKPNGTVHKRCTLCDYYKNTRGGRNLITLFTRNVSFASTKTNSKGRGTGNTIFEKKKYFTYYCSLRNLASLVLSARERSERSYLGTLIFFNRPTGWKQVTFAPPRGAIGGVNLEGRGLRVEIRASLTSI